MAIVVSEVTGPAFLASALVNGDESGLSDQELICLKRFMEGLDDWFVVDVARDDDGNAFDSRFTWCFDLYGGDARGGDVIDYVVHKSTI